MKRAIAGYVRVLSLEPKASSQSIEEQQALRLQEAGATEVFADVSADATTEQIELRRLMEAVRTE